MKNKKIIIPIAIVVGLGAIALGVILGLKACSKDTGNETETSVIITNENGETFISTADSTVPVSSGDIVTDGTDKSDADRNDNTLGSDTSDTSGSSTSGTTSGSGNGSGNGTTESTTGTNGTTKPTENIPPPETEEGEILIIEPTTNPTSSGNGGSGNGGKNPTTSPTSNGGGSSNQPTTNPTSSGNGGGSTTPAPTSSGDGVIELPFVPIEDIEGVE